MHADNSRTASRPVQFQPHGPRWLIAAICLAVVATGCRGERPSTAAVSEKEPAAAAVPADDFHPEPGFRMLALADFESFPADGRSWSEHEGILVCSGRPKGYLYSRERFGNFTLRAEYRFVPPPDLEPAEHHRLNTGFMIHIQEPHRIWPPSLEVQGRFDEIASIKSNGGVPDLVIHDEPAARQSARHAAADWNDVEIVSRDGALSSILNGTPVCTSEPGPLSDGRIGLQSEGFEVHFRRLRVRIDE